MVNMFENIDKEKNKKNAIIGLILIAIPLILYINNNNLKLPNIDGIKYIEIIKDDKLIKKIENSNQVKEVLNDLENIHKSYLVLGNDPTKRLLEVKIIMDNKKDYIITLRDSTVTYNGHLYDISPGKYYQFIEKYSKINKN